MLLILIIIPIFVSFMFVTWWILDFMDKSERVKK